MQKLNRLLIVFALIVVMAGAAAAQSTLFEDNFNSSSLDTTKWKRGSNSSGVTIQSDHLHVVSQSSGVTGWIVTKPTILSAHSKSVSLKILKPGIESDLGLCPTSPPASAPNGIYDQPNFYRFYISGDNNQPPYKFFVTKKKSGAGETEIDTLTLPAPYRYGNTPFDIRIKLGDEMIYFEYSLDGCYWYAVHWEFFDLPGYSTSWPFIYEIAASNKLVNGNPDIPDVDDFKIESYPGTTYPVTTILNDPLNNASFNSSPIPGVSRKVYGGSFSGAGWKPNSSKPDGNEVTDMVVYDLGRYIENGSLEIDVTQFNPSEQNNTNETLVSPRHHVLAMFRMPWGGHHAVENMDTFWDLHTGMKYSGGVKFMSNTYYSCDEFATEITGAQKPWVKTSPYHLKIVWDNRFLKYYRNDTCHAWHILKNSMQLRYIYVGRDSTVSGDFVTGFLHNQYPTMSDADGPIYSNLMVKEFRSNETAPPAINSPSIVNYYQNAARLSWSTNEAAVCYIEYGLTTAYGQKTKLLGPPAISFTTLLSNLNSNTLYHYRITVEDDAGNVAQSNDLTFTTTTNGVYAFKPVADTYIEDNDNTDNPNPDYPWLYGSTRAEGNYGWMNLMTALYRDSFLQFNVSGVGNIAQATLRLYGRQTSVTGANVRQFTPLQSSWEMNATWTDANTNHQYLNRSVYSSAPLLGSISSTTAGQWHSIDVSAATRDANNNYYFVLQGTGAPTDQNGILAKVSCGAFDSRESTNNQPELIVSTAQPAFTEMNISLLGIEDGDVAWGDYDRDEDMDIVITGLGMSDLPLSKIYRNDNNGSSFTDISASLDPLSYSAADWGDFDMDNDLDLLLAGQSNSGQVTKVYRNVSNSFVAYAASLIGIKFGDVAWGNYNHDPYLDILLSGQGTNSGFATKVYQGAISGSTRTWNLNTSINLPQLKHSTVAWGDNNLDGWLDLLVAGIDSNSVNKIEIYRNKKNSNGTRGFDPATIQPPQVMTASVAWGNFEGEDYLDIAFAGRTNTTTKVYQRTTPAYIPVDTLALIGVKQGTVAWGDYDNDGDLDLLVTGEKSNPTERISKVYRNDAYLPNVRKFVDIGAPLAGVHKGAAAWGDYDNDGDLDILLAGNTNASGAAGRITKIYQNILNVPNTTPSAPTNLTVSYSPADSIYTLKWNKSTDNQTPQAALTYNVMIGTSSNSFDIVSPLSNKYNGKRWIPARGNAETDTSYILNRRGLANGTYYWKVQAIDNVWKGSAFSAEGTFTVPYTTAKAAGSDSLADSDSMTIAHAIPKTFALSQNYPNPFNPSTRLNLNLPENGRVKAMVYDLTGQEVARLQDAEMTAGYRYLDWDGKNIVGATVSSGTYLVKVVFEGVSGLRKETTSRVTLLK